MAFGGGGFFGSGASQSEAFGGQVGSTDTFANNNAYASAPVINFTDSRKASGKYVTQKKNSLNVNVVTTDYGAIESSYGFAGAVYEDSIGLAAESLYAGYEQQGELLGEIGNFAELSAETARYQAETSAQQTEYALDFAENLTSQNADLAEEFGRNLGSAYESANIGLLSLAEDSVSTIAGVYESSLDTIAEHSQASQDASATAMDYVFQSTKSESERITGTVVKWGAILGGLAIAAPVIAKMVKA